MSSNCTDANKSSSKVTVLYMKVTYAQVYWADNYAAYIHNIPFWTSLGSCSTKNSSSIRKCYVLRWKNYVPFHLLEWHLTLLGTNWKAKLLPVLHNLLLLGSHTCSKSLLPKFFNHYWMFFSAMSNFLWAQRTLWCLTCRKTCCFDLSTFHGSEGSSNTVFCTI